LNIKPARRALYFIIIFLACVFLFFTNDFGLVDIRKTAIITAVGVDKEDDGFLVSALIAVPKPSSGQKSTAETVVSGSGKTVSFALSEIADKTGWVPKLVFCQTVIVGEEVAKDNVMTALEYFIRDEYMSDSCMIACASGTASEILSVKSPTDSLTSVALSSVLGNEANQSGKATVINLKDFAIGYYGEAHSSYMPVIEKTAPSQNSMQNSMQNSSQSSSAIAAAEAEEGGSEGEESSSGAESIFSSTATAMFLNGAKVGELNAEQTFMFNVLRTRLRFAVFDAESDGRTYSLGLRRNKGRIRFSVEDTFPKMDVEIKVAASVADADFAEDIRDIMYSSVVPEKVKRAAEERMENILSDIFIKCQNTGCDLFRVIDKLKKFESRYYEAYKSDVLRLCRPSFKATILSAKKN